MLSFPFHKAAATDGANTACGRVEAGYRTETSVKGPVGATAPVMACIDVLRGRDGGPRRLRIFVAGRQVISSDDIARGPSDGGIMGDPFQGVILSHGSVVVKNYGGSAWRWNETWRLTIRQGQWIIAGWDEEYWHAGSDNDGLHVSVNALTGTVREDGTLFNDDAVEPPPPVIHKTCLLPRQWRTPSIMQAAAIGTSSWECDARLGTRAN